MILDIIALLLLVLALFKGLRNGLVLAVFSVLAFIIGLAAAVKLSALAAEYIEKNFDVSQRWLPVLAFLAVFLLVVIAVRIGARAVEKVLQLALLGWLNRLGGVVLYMLLYLFVYSVVLFYAEGLRLVRPETAQASVTYPYIAPLGPKVINGLGVVLPFFRSMFAELEGFFDGVAQSSKSS
ncbi:MAG TPA: CvpA family protein [Chitinophagaceae bacterium]|jgi:membrane protein required for colicin V production|nr:CvpA family protein [Chitinophagaceae bacterium]